MFPLSIVLVTLQAAAAGVGVPFKPVGEGLRLLECVSDAASICENLRFCTVELLAFFVNGIFFFGFIGFISPLLLSNTSSGRS